MAGRRLVFWRYLLLWPQTIETTTLIPGNALPDGTTPLRPLPDCLTDMQRSTKGRTAGTAAVLATSGCCATVEIIDPGRFVATIVIFVRPAVL